MRYLVVFLILLISLKGFSQEKSIEELNAPLERLYKKALKKYNKLEKLLGEIEGNSDKKLELEQSRLYTGQSLLFLEKRLSFRKEAFSKIGYNKGEKVLIVEKEYDNSGTQNLSSFIVIGDSIAIMNFQGFEKEKVEYYKVKEFLCTNKYSFVDFKFLFKSFYVNEMIECEDLNNNISFRGYYDISLYDGRRFYIKNQYHQPITITEKLLNGKEKDLVCLNGKIEVLGDFPKTKLSKKAIDLLEGKWVDRFDDKFVVNIEKDKLIYCYDNNDETKKVYSFSLKKQSCVGGLNKKESLFFYTLDFNDEVVCSEVLLLTESSLVLLGVNKYGIKDQAQEFIKVVE